MALTISLLVFLGVAVFFVGLDRALNQPSVIDSRLDRYARRSGVTAEMVANAEVGGIAGRLNRMIASPTMSKQLELNLARGLS
jgi:hypothetical protein